MVHASVGFRHKADARYHAYTCQLSSRVDNTMTRNVRIWVPAGECFRTRLYQLSLVVLFLLALSACSDASDRIPVVNDPVDTVDRPKEPVFDDPAPANVSDPLPADEDALLLAFDKGVLVTIFGCSKSFFLLAPPHSLIHRIWCRLSDALFHGLRV